MNSYQYLKRHISDNLKKNIDHLNDNTIKEQVSNAKAVLDTIGVDMYAQIIAAPALSKLQEEDWKRLQMELEAEFNVKNSHGIIVQGNQQRERDTTWWSNKKKQDYDLFYWNRYKKYLEEELPKEVVKSLNVDTDIVMDNLEDPDVGSFTRYGMVVGHVQSGKTANYSSLVCKAADAGYKFIVVIAGGINNLRDQTQKRLNEAFVGKNFGVQVGAGIGNSPLSKLPISLTTTERDFNKLDADKSSQGQNFDNSSTPILIVIKKNTNTLTNVISWLESQYKNKIQDHAMLMIDDESDYASINTKEEDDPTAINMKLRKLLSLFDKSAYVAYTATPYANIFIDHEAGHEGIGKDLFPKDFIYALETPSNYFGARKIFLDTNKQHLVEITDYEETLPLKHKIDDDLVSIPESLKDAIRVFLINLAIRNLRGQGGMHNSMLIHATRFTRFHQMLSSHVEEYVDILKKHVNAFGLVDKTKTGSLILEDLETTFEKHFKFEKEFNWNQILQSLGDLINTVIIREVHQKTSLPLEYRDDRPSNVIVIGGTSVSRGFTLEGLSVSYFLRSTIFYDTLMQMGRWFGYRNGYEDLCKIFMPSSIVDNFSSIIEATEDLFEDFSIMAEAKRTPEDFGLAVKQRPETALQVTARNKQKNIQDFIFEMKLDGHAKETSWLLKDPEARDKNLDAIGRIVANLVQEYKTEEVGTTKLWREVDKSIVKEFVKDFAVYQSSPIGINARMPIDFVHKYIKEMDFKWDVALYSGTGSNDEMGGVNFKRQERQSDTKDHYIEIKQRQVSTGSAEAVALPKEIKKKIGSNRKAARKELKNPLLMLHVLETNDDPRLAAFGISFPGDSASRGRTVKLKINTVYYKQIIEELEMDRGADD